MIRLIKKYFVSLIILLILSSCSSIPLNTKNSCDIFSEKYFWYKHAKKAEKKWGALIVIQRETGLRSYKEAGTPLKAEVSTPLLMSIFNPGSPMHDGAVILQNTLLEAAGCILPLTESPMVLPEMGTRHRAALGITEESDAIVVVVSEERGTISTAENGRFTHLDIDEMKLRRYLNERLFISSGD